MSGLPKIWSIISWFLVRNNRPGRPHKIHWSKRFGRSNTANMKGDSFSSLHLLTPMIKTGSTSKCKAEVFFQQHLVFVQSGKSGALLCCACFCFQEKIFRILEARKLWKSELRVSWILARPRIWLNKWINQVAPKGLCLFWWSFMDVWWPCHQKKHCFTRNGGPERYIQHCKNTPFMDHSSWSRQFWQKPKQFHLYSFSRTSDKIGLVDQRWPVCFGRFWRKGGFEVYYESFSNKWDLIRVTHILLMENYSGCNADSLFSVDTLPIFSFGRLHIHLSMLQRNDSISSFKQDLEDGKKFPTVTWSIGP